MSAGEVEDLYRRYGQKGHSGIPQNIRALERGAVGEHVAGILVGARLCHTER